MSQVKKRKKNFGEWLMSYRKIIFLSLFFILLPVVIVISLYSGTKANGQKVYFEEGSSYITTSKFIDVDKFDDFNLTIDYTRMAKLYDPEDEELLIGNKYHFAFSYTKRVTEVSDVTIKPVLVGPWSNYSATINSVVLTETINRNISIDFLKLTPYQPRWFVTIKNPILYLEVSYKTANGLQLTKYVSFDLAKDNSVIIE